MRAKAMAKQKGADKQQQEAREGCLVSLHPAAQASAQDKSSPLEKLQKRKIPENFKRIFQEET